MDTKEHILKTSLQLFLQKSYRDVTMKELVAKTGLSKGAFYHYFESKEALFKEIVNHFFSFGKIDYEKFQDATFKDFCNSYLKHLTDSMGQILAFTGNNENKENPNNFFYILFEAVRRFPEYSNIELEMHKEDVKAWCKIIQKAKESGEIKSSASNETIAETFLYCFDGIALRGMTITDKNFMAMEIAHTVKFLYEGIGT